MGRLAIRRVEYFGDLYSYSSPELPDGLVIIEGTNGSGKTTFADMIYFGLGGSVKKFAKHGSDQHKEIREDTNNGVRLVFDIGDNRYSTTRQFDAPSDVLITSFQEGHAEVLPIARRENRRIFSDWLLEALGIQVVTLFLGTYGGKLNFTDISRLIYHDQDPDPARVFKKADNDNFVSDSRDFRRAIFEILIGKASESYYKTLGELKLAQASLAEYRGALSAFTLTIDRVSKTFNSTETQNSDFIKKEIQICEMRIEHLQILREEVRRTTPESPSSEQSLVELRRKLSQAEETLSDLEQKSNQVRTEKIRLNALISQFIDEAERIRRIIHTHETLALFSPDTCPCCLRTVDRVKDHCICGNDIGEQSYQRFFYKKDEYINILKSRQKNIETVRAALESCDSELDDLNRQQAEQRNAASQARNEIGKWAGSNGTYTTELQRLDDDLVSARIHLEQLKRQLALEQERDHLGTQVSNSQYKVNNLMQITKGMEAEAYQDRSSKLLQFDKIYSELMRATLKDVRFARLDANYEPVINDSEYREASATVTRRLMFFVTLLKMALEDPALPFPRFLLIDTPETAGIDLENLIRAIGLLSEITEKEPKTSQVILTTGEGKYPPNLKTKKTIILTNDKKLLVPKQELSEHDQTCSESVVDKFLKLLTSGLNEIQAKSIKAAIDDFVYKTIQIEADSRFFYDANVTDVEIIEFEINKDEDGVAIAEFDEIESDILIATINLSVHISVECEFALSLEDPIDHDEVPAGNALVKKDFTLDLIVAITSNVTSTKEFKFKSVEISDREIQLHMGEIEPDEDNMFDDCGDSDI